MTQRLEDRNEPESSIIANIRRGVIGQQEEEAIMGGLGDLLTRWINEYNRKERLILDMLTDEPTRQGTDGSTTPQHNS